MVVGASRRRPLLYPTGMAAFYGAEVACGDFMGDGPHVMSRLRQARCRSAAERRGWRVHDFRLWEWRVVHVGQTLTRPGFFTFQFRMTFVSTKLFAPGAMVTIDLANPRR